MNKILIQSEKRQIDKDKAKYKSNMAPVIAESKIFKKTVYERNGWVRFMEKEMVKELIRLWEKLIWKNEHLIQKCNQNQQSKYFFYLKFDQIVNE